MVAIQAARTCAGGFLISAFFLLAACVGGLQSERLPAALFPDPIELTQVAFFPQEEYQCGPAALATVLHWAGVAVTPAELAPAVYLPERRGSLQLELLAAARRYGAVPYVLRPDLRTLLREVQAGHPVVVLQNLAFAWYPKWHYAVVVGFDLARDELVLRSGTALRRSTPLAVFERTWRRGDYWAMVVMPPGKIPRTAEETPYLQSVLAIERLGKWEATSRAYAGAMQRWPHSLAAQLGLGNSRYALGDWVGAERAFRAAITMNPDSGIAYNNLAQTLAEQHRWTEAEQAAQRALALGGRQRETFAATLEEIRARRHGD